MTLEVRISQQYFDKSGIKAVFYELTVKIAVLFGLKLLNIHNIFVIIMFMKAKTKTIIGICCVIAFLLIALLSVAITVAAKGYERFTVSDKLSYDEQKVAQNMAEPKDLCLAVDGKSGYCVVYPEQYSEEFVNDANYFADVLGKIFGDTVAVYADGQLSELPQKAFVIGDSVFSKTVSIEGVVDDGYRVVSDGDRIYIKGLSETAARNGLYGFLEENLEVMFIEENFDYVPSFPTVYLDKLDYISNPDIRWRSVYQYEVLQSSWYDRLRLNGREADGTKEGIHKGWGTWCHSAFLFVDPDKYFESNPEYFALVGGERKATQLCYSYFAQNEDAFKIIDDSLNAMIQANPEATYWDFSILDNMDYCQCDLCKKTLKNTGSMMGTLLPIINKLAVLHKDKIISTLAYTFCKDVPEGMVCEDNVNIVVAPINTSQNYSLAVGGNLQSAQGKKMIESWGKVSKNLLVWDYVVDFKHLLMPYPNYAVQQANIEFYIDNNVTAVFHQGSREKENEMARLRSYLLARQLWDSDIDMEKLMAKYLVVAYGEACDEVAHYIDRMSDTTYFLPGNLDLYDNVVQHQIDYLAVTTLNEYVALIRKGMDETKDDESAYERLERIYMNLMYARCLDSSLNVDKKTASAQEFYELAQKYGVERVSETGVSLDEWYTDYTTNTIDKTNAFRIVVITLSSVFPMVLIGVALTVVTTTTKKRRIIIQREENNVED